MHLPLLNYIKLIGHRMAPEKLPFQPSLPLTGLGELAPFWLVRTPGAMCEGRPWWRGSVQNQHGAVWGALGSSPMKARTSSSKDYLAICLHIFENTRPAKIGKKKKYGNFFKDSLSRAPTLTLTQERLRSWNTKEAVLLFIILFIFRGHTERSKQKNIRKNKQNFHNSITQRIFIQKKKLYSIWFPQKHFWLKYFLIEAFLLIHFPNYYNNFGISHRHYISRETSREHI